VVGRSALSISSCRGQGRNGGNKQRSDAGHGSSTQKLATIHVDVWRSSGILLVKKRRLAKLLDCQRKQRWIRCDIESNGKLGRDTFCRPPAFLEQLKDACRGWIKEMNLIPASVINHDLLVERVLQKSSSDTRKRSHSGPD
jgi:hypothetical protein